MNTSGITRNTTVMRGGDEFRFYTKSFYNYKNVHRGEIKTFCNNHEWSTLSFEISSANATMRVNVANKIDILLGVGRNNLGDIDNSLFDRVVEDVTQPR
jgi:hypothetical protein